MNNLRRLLAAIALSLPLAAAAGCDSEPSDSDSSGASDTNDDTCQSPIGTFASIEASQPADPASDGCQEHDNKRHRHITRVLNCTEQNERNHR